MGFGILGPLLVTYEDRDITPTAPKIRQVLAFLLVRRNHIIQASEFVDELWGDNPPDSAMTTLQTYIYRLRKDVLDPTSGLARLHTQSCGYVLEVADEIIDAGRFDRLARQGQEAQQGGHAVRTSQLLTEALALWRGQALSGVPVGEILSAHVTRLEESKLRVLGMRIETDMRLGRYEELISELSVLVRTYPLHERFHANLMRALNRSGRRSEAFEVYRRLRDLLVDELGVEPSAGVQQLHHSLLNAGPAERLPPPRPAAAGRPAPLGTVPAQLPPDIPDFTGRAEAVSLVRGVLTAPDGHATAARAVSICGVTGVGKTTLALHVAHLDKAQHPDGQLFADLRGSSTNPASPREVLAGFLRALGVPDHQIPATVEECSSLFRTWSSGRRLLVVLDDAVTRSQVAPLIPATPESAVIITSRWGMHGLPGAQTMKLDVLTTAEGVDLLGRIIGVHRVAAEPDQAERIVDHCGNLPLALRCVGARLTAAPTWSLHKMATTIDASPAPLDQLRFADFDVRAAFDKTYFRLEPRDRSVLRLLSLLPPPHFTAATAASLLGTGADVAEAQLSRLVACHLVDARSDDDTEVIRYELSRLTRIYARERLNREFIEPPHEEGPQGEGPHEGPHGERSRDEAGQGGVPPLEARPGEPASAELAQP